MPLPVDDRDVLVPRLARGALVDLQPEDALLGNRRIGLRVIDRFLTVEPQLDVPSFATAQK